MYNIELLVKLSSLPKRTIRYYIQIGLLDPPVGNCRGSYYTDAHLTRLEQVKKWSDQGVPLSQIKSIINGEAPSVTADKVYALCTSQWEKIEICAGIELHFRMNYLKMDELNKINSFINEVLKDRVCDDN
jgi:DNA-binding transcriptional MerR regulator